MASSPAFQRFAELYYECKLPILDASLHGSQGKVIFGDNGSKIEVIGDDQQFLDTIQYLVPTVRDGVEQLIDVRDTPAGDLETYMQNWEYFLTSEEDPIQKATVRINQGDVAPPQDFDAKEALEASIELDFDNKELKKLVNNYSELLAVKQSDANRKNQPFRKYRDNASYDKERFEEIYYTSVDILQEVYLDGSPLNCYQDWHNTCETDLQNLSERILTLKKRKEIEWESLKSRDSGTPDGEIYFEFWENKSDDSEKGVIEGEIGIERIINQYAKLFELAREPLRDLAAALDDKDTVDLSNTADVLEFLNSNGQQSFTEPIEPQLRHGSSHASIKPDDSNGILEISNNRGKSRKLVKKVNYKDAPSAYYHLSDAVAGLIFAFFRVNDRVILRYMSSEEFRHRMVENIPPEGFSV